MDLVVKLKAFAMAEARHGIGRERKDLFNEAADRIEKLEAQLVYERRLLDAAATQCSYVEDHYPEVFDESERAVAEHLGLPEGALELVREILGKP
jgi:hypothetical protein